MLCLAAVCACSKAENTYSSTPAYFAYVGTNTVPQLNKALNSSGQYCTVKQDASHFIFTSTTGQDVTNREAIQNYRNFRLGLGVGLIVGLPTIPEMGADVPRVVCFDLACPNCWESDHRTLELTLHEGGTATCHRGCQRGYDLNNQGLVTTGAQGRSLYRYRVTYVPYTLRVVNQ